MVSSYRPESEAISREDTPDRACIPTQSDSDNGKYCLDYAHDKEPMRLLNEGDLSCCHIGDLNGTSLDKRIERIAGVVDVDYVLQHTGSPLTSGGWRLQVHIPPLAHPQIDLSFSLISTDTRGRLLFCTSRRF